MADGKLVNLSIGVPVGTGRRVVPAPCNYRVSDILPLRAFIQMIWVHTYRIVACVVRVHAWEYRATQFSF